MSKSKNNLITKHYSGKLGNQISLRNLRHCSVMAILPDASSKGPSAKQRAHQHLFKKASRYARSVYSDPFLKNIYEKKTSKSLTVYKLALSDFLNPPVVHKIDSSGYKGKIGDKIMVDAVGRFSLRQIKITITGPNGKFIEEGNCILDTFHILWEYTATAEQSPLSSTTITATAYDYPGHKGVGILKL